MNPPSGLWKRTMRAAVVFLIAMACSVVFATDQRPGSTPGEGNGIGGTGYAPGEGNGIGGTGAPPLGSPSALGIVGTVTGLGSIFVNGYEVDYAPATPVRSDLYDEREARLIRVGQVVEVEAEGSGKRVRARNISVRYEVAGRIESIDRAAGTLRVLGQTVSARDGIVGARSGSFSDLSAGDTVDVSGFRRADGVIVASRIDQAPAGRPAWLRGRVESVNGNAVTVAGVRIDRSAPNAGALPAAGEEVAILGAYSSGTLKPARVMKSAIIPFSGRVAKLSVEGFVRPGAGGGKTLGGLSIGDARASAGSRVIVDGRLGSRGRLLPTTVREPIFHRNAPQGFMRPGFHNNGLPAKTPPHPFEAPHGQRPRPTWPPHASPPQRGHELRHYPRPPQFHGLKHGGHPPPRRR